MRDTDLIIRPAALEDAATLASLQARVFAATYGAAIPSAILESYLARTFAPALIAAELAHLGISYLVAAHNGAIVGVSKLAAGAPINHTLPDAVELARLYLDDGFHGRGVARALLDHTLAAGRMQGYRTIWLCVWKRNLRAIPFYRKHGFVEFGQMPVFVDDIRFDDLLMRRTLHDN